MRRTFLLLAVLIAIACPLTHAARAGGTGDDFWTGWRERQRKELSELPEPPVPPGDGPAIDRFLAAHWQKHGFTPPAAVADHVFARRVYLDVIGLLPTPAQLAAFAEDTHPDKRARLVDALLADKTGYAEGWMAWWNDLLRNDEQTNIDGLPQPITQWLFASLRDTKPLDLIVAELLHPRKNRPDGYPKG